MKYWFLFMRNYGDVWDTEKLVTSQVHSAAIICHTSKCIY